MTYRVVLALAFASEAIASPTGNGSGATRFSIIDTSGNIVQTQDVNAAEASFSGLADGTFTATAQLLDTAGAVLGDAVSTTFVDGNQVPTDPGQGDGSQPSSATYIPLASLSATVTPE